jgi:predicted dienelactone hydrolase
MRASRQVAAHLALKGIFVAAALAVLAFTASADAAPEPSAGMRTIHFSGDARHGDFDARLWYPTTGGETAVFAQSRIRKGYRAVPDGPVAPLHGAPLIILVHGSGGSADNMAWIGTELAKRGAVVVAADHPGSSGGDSERASILQLWDQPRDIRLMIDQLAKSEWAARIDTRRIAVVGFSLGGTTAMLTAGARVKLEMFPDFCTRHDDGACRAFARHFAAFDKKFYEQADADLSELRLRAAVAVAPGFMESMTPESLAAIRTPLLVLAGDRDQQLPPATHARPMLAHLSPATRYREIEGAQHFSFMPECREGAEALLAETHEEFVCQELGAKTRPQIQHEALEEIAAFLHEHGLLD